MASHHHQQHEEQQHRDVQPPPHPQQQLQQQQHYQQQQQQQINATAPGGQPVFDLGKFWQEEMHNADTFDSDFKNHPLPLARIKKVMKTDQDVKVKSCTLSHPSLM
jgi:nuclear transcription factor Y gamma